MNEWIDVNEFIPTHDCIVRVRLSDGTELDACFFEDQMNWLEFYGFQIGYWWMKDSNQLINNVTHWLRK